MASESSHASRYLRQAAVFILAFAAGAASAVTLDQRVAASADDAEEDVATRVVDLTSSDLELVRNGSAPQVVGIRFPGLAIPGGATIDAAWVQFETDEAQTLATSLTIQGDTGEQSPIFVAANGNVSDRPRSASSVGWTPVAWSVIGEQGPNQRTPSLVPVVQELVSASSWVAGDSLSLIIMGTGRRTARSWNGVAAGAPLLHVEYTAPSNQRPVLTVTSPRRGSTYVQGMSIAFTGTAIDSESGDLSGNLTWISNIDGIVGVGASFSRSDLSVGVHTVTASVSDGQGGVATRSHRVTVFAPVNQVLAAGDIGNCTRVGDEATGALLETLPGTILALGDLAYPHGSTQDFANCYEPGWGPHKARTLPIAGNHEYETPNAAPYFAYFGAVAAEPSQGWYSYDLAGWHVVALNSNCTAIGGCGANSAQGLWLEADLAANSKPCTMALMHHYRFSSISPGLDPRTLEFWQILYDHGVDVILTGHDHAYERFARQDPYGVAQPTRGIRAFIAGMGGSGLVDAIENEINSEARDSTSYGVLALTLEPTSFAWQFMPAAGGTFSDAGTDSCVFGAPVVTITSPAPGASFPPGATVNLAGSATDLEQGVLSSELAWSSSRDGELGTAASLSVVLSPGGHVLTASVTDETQLTGSSQLSITVSGGSAGCGLGPELVPGLLALQAAGRRLRRKSR